MAMAFRPPALEFEPITTLLAVAATCDAEVLIVCKSIAFAPRALPPVAVPSGMGPAMTAPVPFGVRATLMFVSVPRALNETVAWVALLPAGCQ